MMYHLDGRWRRQSLVYFGRKTGDLAYRHTRNPPPDPFPVILCGF